jgi:hypothetical protein
MASHWRRSEWTHVMHHFVVGGEYNSGNSGEGGSYGLYMDWIYGLGDLLRSLCVCS